MKSKMNVPNTLSLIRALLVPVFVATLLFMRNIPVWCCVVPTIVYILTGLTDMLDGKIARKYNLVTDFGKFIDPLADKFMVIGSAIAILVWMMLRGQTTEALVFVWVVLIILLRELGVTSLRLVVAGKSGTHKGRHDQLNTGIHSGLERRQIGVVQFGVADINRPMIQLWCL